MKFCTKEDVKGKFIQVGAAVTPQTTFIDATIDALIEIVSEEIATYCRRGFKKIARTEYHPSPDSYNSMYAPRVHRVFVKEPPIDNTVTLQTFAIVGYSFSRYFNVDAPYEEVTSLYLTYDYEKGIIDINLGLIGDARGIKVVYTGGYAETGGVVLVPNDLKFATAMQVAFNTKRVMEQSVGQTTYMKDGNVSSYGRAGLIPEVVMAISKYRKPLIGSL